MVNEETIYMGNIREGNTDKESAIKEVMAKAWKPVTIGSLTGIVIGTGAILATRIDMESGVSEEELLADDNKKTQDSVVPETGVDTDVNAPALKIAAVEDGISFEDAFAAAREQVGPGGVFEWRGVIFSTYTADEWESMTEDEHDSFAEMVRPEVEAQDVSEEEIRSEIAQNEPDTDVEIDDLAQEDVIADANDIDVIEDLADNAAHLQEMDLDEVVDDVAIQESDEGIAIADLPVQEDDEDIAIADLPAHEVEEGVVVADFPDADPDVVVADAADEVQDIAFAEDDEIRLSEMFSLQPGDDVAMANAATKGESLNDDVRGQDASFENFLSDSSVRIVGYGEFDGHVVRGLDLDGDDMVDIAVIDVDDSGDLSREDIIMEEGNGNQATYGELQDFALNQSHDDHDSMTPNPDVADDMPDYMDDALAQL